MDLYRLSGASKDLLPLNLDHVFDECISLIEWPERLGTLHFPSERLDITIHIDSDHANEQSQDNDSTSNENSNGDDDNDDMGRIMMLQPHGTDWEMRLQTIKDEGYLDDLLI